MLKRSSLVLVAGLSGLTLAALLTACGGGGGGNTSPPISPSSSPPSTSPSISPSTSPSTTPSTSPAAASISGIAAINGVPIPNARLVFSCGCTGQAGTATADAGGNFTIGTNTTATPSAPVPTYTTVPGRNYLDVITAPNGAQVWDISFLGSSPTRNHYLNATNRTDQYTTAAALYIFYNSISSTKQDAFDTWNFDTIASWIGLMETAPLAQETTLLSDIITAQTNHVSLYPSNGAAWAPAGTVPNATIKHDIDTLEAAVLAAGQTARLPQQCAPAGVPCAVPTP